MFELVFLLFRQRRLLRLLLEFSYNTNTSASAPFSTEMTNIIHGHKIKEDIQNSNTSRWLPASLQ